MYSGTPSGQKMDCIVVLSGLGRLLDDKESDGNGVETRQAKQG